MNIVDRYEQRIFEAYMASNPSANPDVVRQLISEKTQECVRNIPCRMHNNMTREDLQSSIVDVCEWIETRNPIVTGNGTFFMQHEEYLAPTVIFLETNKKNRSVVKKKMYTFDPGTPGYLNNYSGQINIKVIMNADYGGSGTTDSPFYSLYIPPATTGSAKAMTTSLICSLEFISDNSDKWSKLNNLSELMDMVYVVLETDMSGRENIIVDNFTTDQVVGRLVSKVNNISFSDMAFLKRFIDTLNVEQKSRLMLAFNVKYVLSNYLSTDMQVISSYLKEHKIDMENITEESIKDAGFGVEAPEAIADRLKHINNAIIDNCIYPFYLNDNEVRAANMKRVIVCVTDTDSLMVHFANYIKEFQTDDSVFRDSCIMATAIGKSLFVENIIPALTNGLAINCRVKDPYYRKKFVFKNEFGFLAMALFKKKMYAASMFVQEGNPRNPHKIAITGMSFKKRDAAEFLEPVMIQLYDKNVLTCNTVDVEGILDTFYQTRDMLFNSIDKTTEYFKVLSIKDITAYDSSRALPDQMRGAIVWNSMMPDEEMMPMDRVIVVPLSFAKLHEYAPTSARIGRLLNMCKTDDSAEKKTPFICLPEHYKQVPDWISPVIDKDYAIDKILSPFKQILGLFDVYMADTRSGMIPSRMVYI